VSAMATPIAAAPTPTPINIKFELLTELARLPFVFLPSLVMSLNSPQSYFIGALKVAAKM
jgi:hypothetical protein